MGHTSADTSLAGTDLRGSDLRGKDFTNHVLFGTDLRGARLYGLKIALKCQSFDGVKLDSEQVGLLLLMISLADIDPDIVEALRALVKEHIGAQALDTMSRYLQIV